MSTFQAPYSRDGAVVSRVGSLQCPSPSETVSANEIATSLVAGKKLLYDSVTVDGDLDLSSVHSITVPLGLRNSVVQGRVIAPSTIFESSVEFSGSCFESSIDLSGATFEGDARWTGATLLASLDGRAARFKQSFDLTNVTAVGPVSFENAVFTEDASAQGAIFGGMVSFANARFQADARLSRARFGSRAAFENATVTGDADFSIADFAGPANFTGLTSQGRLDFLGAAVHDTLILDGASASSLRLEGNTFDEGEHPLALGNLDVGGMEMDLSTIDRIAVGADKKNQQLSALHTIEETARSDGKTRVANDAAFRRDVLENRDRPPVSKLVWFVFGEQIFGYLVKPWRPLRAMLALVLVGMFARTAADWTANTPAGGAAVPKALHRRLRQSAANASAALSVAWRLSPPTQQQPIDEDSWWDLLGAGALWSEWGAQKALNAVFLIALGNAVPGVKEIVDSLID